MKSWPSACTAVIGGWWLTYSAIYLYLGSKSNSKVSPNKGLKGLSTLNQALLSEEQAKAAQ